MSRNDIAPNLLERLIHEKLSYHPLPWRIEQDWTLEVTDAKDHIVLKCINFAEATELIDRANALHRELEEDRAWIEQELSKE